MGTQYSMFYDPLFLMITFGIIVFSVCVSSLIRFSSFRVMISFSFLIWSFSCIYIILNMAFYLFPPLENLMLTDPSAKWIAMFFYGMCPFITLTFIILFLFTLPSYRERINYNQEIKKAKSKGKGNIYILLKCAAILALIIMAIVFFTFALT